MSSIRGKIGLAYGSLSVLGMVFMGIVYADLRYLEQRIADGVAVSHFREQTLEMRRHEKNFFLYRDPSDRLEAIRFADAAASELHARHDLYASLTPEANLTRLAGSLALYRRLLEVSALPDEVAASAIRAAGHDVSSTAESLGRQERTALAAAVKSSTQAMMAFALGVVLLGVLAGQGISRMVARPLRELEAELKPLAEGRFREFHAPSRDREFVSLTQALNRMLEELDIRRRQVLQSEKLASMGVLASGVAHELNNPLGNISAAAQILNEELDSADKTTRRDWLLQIEAETERAQRIVRTLLDYARRQDFRPERVALEEVIEKSLLLLGKRRPGPDRLSLDLQPDLAVWVDEQRMQQVFINLLRNALDAGAGRIVIAARRATWGTSRPAPAARVAGAVATMHDRRPVTVIQVRDDGPGIAGEALPHVFDPFFTTRSPGQGVGLGLFVVQEIVAEHGGCVAAENRAEGGACFTIWMPCLNGEERHG